MPQFRGPARYSFVAFRLTPVFLPYGFQFLGIGSGHGGLLSVFDAIQFQELIKSQRGLLPGLDIHDGDCSGCPVDMGVQGKARSVQVTKFSLIVFAPIFFIGIIPIRVMAVIPFHTESEFPHFLPNRVRRDPSQVEIAGIRLLEFAPVTLEQHLSEGVEPVERVIGPAEIVSAVNPPRIPWGVEVEERGTASALPRVVYRACHIRVRLQPPAGLHVVA